MRKRTINKRRKTHFGRLGLVHASGLAFKLSFRSAVGPASAAGDSRDGAVQASEVIDVGRLVAEPDGEGEIHRRHRRALGARRYCGRQGGGEAEEEGHRDGDMHLDG